MIDTCRKLLETYGDVIHLPVDIVVADEVRRRLAAGDACLPTRSPRARWAWTSARGR